MAAGLILRQALSPLGSCGFFAGSFPASPALPLERIVAGGRRYAQFSPPGWLDEYMRRGLDRGTPVSFAPARRVSPFRWSAPGFPELTGWRGLELAREIGVEDGLAVPCHEPDGRVGVISMSFERFDFSPRDIQVIALAAVMTHERMTRFTAMPAPLALGLSQRERDCLAYVADGLSDGEIAEKLGIAQTTAHSHVENAKRKLGARSRAQAVARLFGNTPP
jgi:DNA-binding CsgD family transcriptional regulator